VVDGERKLVCLPESLKLTRLKPAKVECNLKQTIWRKRGIEMKKTVLFVFIALVCTFLVGVGSSWATGLQTPFVGMKYTNTTFTDFDYNGVYNWLNLPNHPLQNPAAESNNVWGIVALTSLHTLTDNNPENNNLSIPAYYNDGDDSKYHFGVYGGLTIRAGTGVVPGELYLQAAPGMTPYMKVYELDAANANAYNLDAAAGPNVAGAGLFGTFGTNIINNGTLWLDTTFSPGTLQYYSLAVGPNDVEKIAISTSTTGKAEGYLDVTGAGLIDYLVDMDTFPFYLPGAPLNRADLKIISDLTVQWNGVQGWTNPLWTTNSQDPVTAGVIPEPATMLLVGSGLLGLAGLSRKRFRKS